MGSQLLSYTPHLLENSAEWPFPQQAITVIETGDVSVVLPAPIEIVPTEERITGERPQLRPRPEV